MGTRSFPAGLGAVPGHPVLVGLALSSVGPGLAPRVVVDVLARAVFTLVTRLPAVERHGLWVLATLPRARPLLALFMLVQTSIVVRVEFSLRCDLCLPKGEISLHEKCGNLFLGRERHSFPIGDTFFVCVCVLSRIIVV